MNLLEIHNLHARIGDKEILKGIDLTIGPGEIHAVMGPNGAGKSTLAAVLTGKPGYEVTEGSITFGGSGTTIVACEQLGRKARLMELDQHYCDIIIARWEKLTGQKAIKLNE